MSMQSFTPEALNIAGLAGTDRVIPKARVIVMTDVLFKSIHSHSFPWDLSLLINFDLPLQKVRIHSMLIVAGRL